VTRSTGHAGTHQPHTVFVLGGGGNLGATQVGMLRALFERGLRPDALVGCSVGALNAGAIAAEPTMAGVERLEAVWLDPETWKVFSPGRFGGPWLLLKRGSSMTTNDRVLSLIHNTVPERHFEDFKVPLHVVATSLATGMARWFSSGDAVRPILASSALPAVLPPVEIQGELFIDGAVVDNVPIERAVQLRAKRVVVLHVGNFRRPRATPNRPLDTLLHAFSIARNERFLRESARDHPGVEVLVLPGIDPGPLRRDDFTRTDELVERAYQTSIAFLESRGLGELALPPVGAGHDNASMLTSDLPAGRRSRAARRARRDTTAAADISDRASQPTR
jgi:NTE family protein